MALERLPLSTGSMALHAREAQATVLVLENLVGLATWLLPTVLTVVPVVFHSPWALGLTGNKHNQHMTASNYYCTYITDLPDGEGRFYTPP